MNNVEKVKGPIKIERVLLSVFNKVYLEMLVKGLLTVNPEMVFYSSTGTYNKILEILGYDEAGKHLVEISDYTGYPEMQGGLVKTLHPIINMGLLAERVNEVHDAELALQNAVHFDLVVVNLYPFSDTIAKDGCTLEMARANIDIGGPTMIRAASKNFHGCAALTDPDDYRIVLAELSSNNGCLSLDTRLALMKKAFAVTATFAI
jgi:phosphoribosylaminoimidazolecarboxamide formyltransferase / IMP cyclohydrolase